MTSKFDWKNKELLEIIVKESITQTEVLNKIGIKLKSGNHQTLLKYVKFHELDISHFDGKKVAYQKLKKSKDEKQLTNEEYFCIDSSRNNWHSKIRILKYELKKHKCEECGCLPEWNGKSLSLQLDHISGDTFDNRLENLRFLCPNCHSQTVTFGSKNKKKEIEKEKVFDIKIFELNKEAPLKEKILLSLEELGIRKSAAFFKMSIKNLKSLCNHYEIDLYKISNNLKIDWPSLPELQKLVLVQSLTDVGKKFELTANAIKRHIRKNNLFLPTDVNKGYWIKKIKNRITFEDLILENGQYKLSPSFNISLIVAK